MEWCGIIPPILYPIGSMDAIYGNIYHQYTPNVSIIHGSYLYGMECNGMHHLWPRLSARSLGSFSPSICRRLDSPGNGDIYHCLKRKQNWKKLTLETSWDYKFANWSWTEEQQPPESGEPQVTTDPSSRIAANAELVAWICCTLLSWSCTAELSPP